MLEGRELESNVRGKLASRWWGDGWGLSVGRAEGGEGRLQRGAGVWEADTGTDEKG